VGNNKNSALVAVFAQVGFQNAKYAMTPNVSLNRKCMRISALVSLVFSKSVTLIIIMGKNTNPHVLIHSFEYGFQEAYI